MPEYYAYWISTALLCLLYLTSATMYLVKGSWVRQALGELGYSVTYLVPFLVVVKILGALAILSRVSVPLSDLAYAGMLFHLILAALAHLGVRKPLEALPAIVGLVLVVISFATQNDVRDVPSPYLQAAVLRHRRASLPTNDGDHDEQTSRKSRDCDRRKPRHRSRHRKALCG